MRGTGNHPFRSLLPKQPGPGADGSTGVDHVVDQDRRPAGDIADHREAFGLIVTGAAFVDDGQRRIVHLFGKGPGPGHAAHIRRHHHDVAEVLGGEVIHQHR